MAAKLERRELHVNQLDKMIDSLERSERPELATVLLTHRTVVERDGYIELGKKMWADIEKHLEIEFSIPRDDGDLTLGEAVDFLADAGMNVIVIDEDGVHDGTLMPDDSIRVDKEFYPDNPDNMSDDEVAELDRKMDLLLAPGVVFSEDGKTAFIPEEVLEEEDPDAELVEQLFPVCACGCEQRTRGGRYLPGHDAKHKGRLMRTAYHYRDTPEGEAATLELNLRGWMKFYPAFAKNEAKRVRRMNVARCEVCGRPLSDEESIERGIGPICAGRH